MTSPLDEKSFPSHRFDGAKEVPSRATDSSAPLDEKALPCNCGGNGIEHWPDGSTRHYIECDKCGRRTATYLASHGGSAKDEWLSATPAPDGLEATRWSAIGVGQMAVDPDGRWVSVRDFDQAQSALAAMRGQLQHLGELASAHRDELEAQVQRLTEDNEALRAERDALRKALQGCWCPRPANNRPDHFTVGKCVAAGECGCCDGAPLMPLQALSGSKE